MQQNRYKIIKLIDKGAYGNIYKSIDLRNNNIVAIKKVKKTSENLYNEVKFPKKFDHPTIIKILDHYSEGKYFNIVTEFYDNPDLFNYIHDNYIPRKNMVHIFHDMVIPIKLLHKKSIVHLDIKPENYIYKNDHLVLIDFGSSMDLLNNKRLNRVYSKVGTLIYSAPEVLNNYVHLNSDIWSLGVSMLNMITMNQPIMNDSIISIDDNLNNIQSKVSSEIFEIMESVLVEDPFERANINTVYHKFQEIIT